MIRICQICKVKKVITDSEIILDIEGTNNSYTSICTTCTAKIAEYIKDLIPQDFIEQYNDRFSYHVKVLVDAPVMIYLYDKVKDNIYRETLPFIPNSEKIKETVLMMIKNILEKEENTNEYTSE